MVAKPCVSVAVGQACLLLLCLALCLALVPTARGSTIRVPSDQPTIQAGISAASEGDTVLVAPGTYTGVGNRDIDFGGTDVVLLSEAGAAATVIDCEASGRGFVFHTFETPAAVVEGFTIQYGDPGGSFGGGLFATMASPTIRDCVFSACQGNQGGGVYVEESSIRVENCDFLGNSAANWGGGFLCKLDSSPILTDRTFSENTAARGEGAYVRGGSTVSMTGCVFSSNEGLSSAGGIYCSDSDLTLAGCTFTQNSAAKGGGVYCEDEATASFHDCTFSMNTALHFGGGVRCEESGTIRLTSCVFEGNLTTGGAIGNGGGACAVIMCPRAPCSIASSWAITRQEVEARVERLACGSCPRHKIRSLAAPSWETAPMNAAGLCV